MTESMTCGRCGRLLKDVRSKDRGYGPVCYKKVQEAKEQHGTENDSGSVQESFEA